MNRGPRKASTWVPLPPGAQEPLISLARHPDGLPLSEIFGRVAPLEVEIGTGKGNTLLQLAQDHADVDYLGIEVGSKWVRLARARLIRAGTVNARLVSAEAEWILTRYLPPGSARRFHVYFPDPWPKKRHAKRRLFQDRFPALLRRCLSPGGEVRIATDHEEYYRQIVAVMQAGGFAREPGAPRVESPVSAFERKYREQGRSIHRVAYRLPR